MKGIMGTTGNRRNRKALRRFDIF